MVDALQVQPFRNLRRHDLELRYEDLMLRTFVDVAAATRVTAHRESTVGNDNEWHDVRAPAIPAQLASLASDVAVPAVVTIAFDVDALRSALRCACLTLERGGAGLAELDEAMGTLRTTDAARSYERLFWPAARAAVYHEDLPITAFCRLALLTLKINGKAIRAARWHPSAALAIPALPRPATSSRRVSVRYHPNRTLRCIITLSSQGGEATGSDKTDVAQILIRQRRKALFGSIASAFCRDVGKCRVHLLTVVGPDVEGDPPLATRPIQPNIEQLLEREPARRLQLAFALSRYRHADRLST
ncbi:MAG: hypothetical protein RBU37_17615 [Myxococcota bacterium]|nr:hypothetical protein [Myxococcota bacterium]